jgi:hypothetical protein
MISTTAPMRSSRLPTPPNHAEWLVAHIRSAVLVASANAPGHADIEDRMRARRAVYAWLIGGGEPITP